MSRKKWRGSTRGSGLGTLPIDRDTARRLRRVIAYGEGSPRAGDQQQSEDDQPDHLPNISHSPAPKAAVIITMAHKSTTRRKLKR